MSGGHVHALYRHGDTILHRLRPQVKIAAAFLFVFAVVATPGKPGGRLPSTRLS